ncbi:hypothetical protein OK016_30245 [Vibrio chagasii]|nr:hypothetical protein [Vibrio chagasii]
MQQSQPTLSLAGEFETRGEKWPMVIDPDSLQLSLGKQPNKY